jgi:hypothetical protein
MEGATGTVPENRASGGHRVDLGTLRHTHPAEVVTTLGWRVRQTLVWVKDRFVLGHAGSWPPWSNA